MEKRPPCRRVLSSGRTLRPGTPGGTQHGLAPQSSSQLEESDPGNRALTRQTQPMRHLSFSQQLCKADVRIFIFYMRKLRLRQVA